MDAGAVVLTTGGWKVQTEEGFAPWHWCGIITHATDDGEMSGSCLGFDSQKARGFSDRPLEYLGACWALSPGEVTMGRPEARTAVLQQAVQRIRGQGPFEAGKRTVYGLRAMDAWIKQMKTVPFCSSCAPAGAEGMAGCAVNNVQTTSAAAKAAASYLRGIAAESPASAQPHLEQAAKHYDRIVELLAPATWSFYRDTLNDVEKQQTHGTDVLGSVRAELTAAADAMKRALEAEQASR
jgi:hypothetical protein